MNLIQILEAKKIKHMPIAKWGPYLKKEWENQFASHLTEQEKGEIYMHSKRELTGFLWHLFSWEKAPYVQKAQARESFNRQAKKSCYIFFEFSDDIVLIEDASKLKIEQLEETYHFDFQDFYIVDKEFTWTYVQTHEDECGPYFYIKNPAL